MNKSLYLIFDLDGCLIDSSEVQKAAFFGSYKEVVGDDHCPSYEEYIKHTGDSVNGMLKKMGLPAAMAASFRRISSESVDKILVNWEAMKLDVYKRQTFSNADELEAVVINARENYAACLEWQKATKQEIFGADEGVNQYQKFFKVWGES